MNENKKFILSKEPFIRKADHSENTATMMRDFLIALTPLIIFAWVKNGLLPFIDGNTGVWGMLYPLVLVLVGAATSVLVEVFWYGVLITNKPLKERLMTSFPAIPGILLGMIVPLATPVWTLIIAVVFATVIGKLIFGGFGQNVFNPALVGYLFLMIAYYGVITGGNGFLNPSEVVDAISSATPMTVFAQNRAGAVNTLIEKYSLWRMFVGLTPGALAETSSLLCLVALVYLLVRKTINWRIPVIYLATVFVITYTIGAFNGYATTFNYALFNLFNGGLMFGAVFMATEPVTSPRNPNGKIIYALGLGVLTVLFRYGSIEGVAISILVMNLFTAIIEKLAAKLRVEPNKKKVILTYAIVGLLFSGIGVYSVTSNIQKETGEHQYTYTFVSAEQKLDDLRIEYKIKVDNDEVTVTVNSSYSIQKVSNPTYNTDAHKTELRKVVNANKLQKTFLSVNETPEALVLKVRVRNDYGSVDVEVTYDMSERITSVVADTTDQSYEYGDWVAGSGHPKDIIPNLIIDNQNDLSAVSPISGATYTSNAIVEGVRFSKTYFDFLDSLTGLLFTGKGQKNSNLNFYYIFHTATGRIVVETDKEYNLITAVDSNIKDEVENTINKNKINNYIDSVDQATKTIVLKTFGYNGIITTTVTYDNDFEVTNISVNAAGEDAPVQEKPENVLPNTIINNWDDLSAVQPVSGATGTSTGIITAAKLAKSYLEYLEGQNE